MLACDIVVAADDARFCQMEAKRGLAPLAGGNFRFLTRMGWGDAMYHLLLVDEFGAAEAHRKRHVVSTTLWLELVQEPQPLLRE